MKIGPRPYSAPLDSDPDARCKRQTEADRQPAQSDSVEISLESRSRLAAQAHRARRADLNGTGAPAETNQPDRKGTNKATASDQVRERIESGFYERSDVRDVIARKLVDEFMREPEQQD